MSPILFLAVRMELFTTFLLLCMATIGYSQTFDVMDYGAAGNGISDDSKAFIEAWKAVCEAASGTPTLSIPKGKTFWLIPMIFQGPCKSPNVLVQLEGNIYASSNIVTDYNTYARRNWIIFSSVNGLTVFGNGQIDGKGFSWWKACPVLSDLCMRPTALAFYGCTNLQVSGLNSINSARNHISLAGCKNAILSNLNLSAPSDSPNTDGIDITSSTNVQIHDSHIGTGDDCIAIGTGSSLINITGIACGPGHGISIGSLGINGEKASVEGVYVKDCSFYSTTNGIRIKTYQGGSGYARNITIENITLFAADNPIIIDQFYCPHNACKTMTSAVHISDVSYNGVHGTTIRDNAIKLSCSQSTGCTNLFLNNINITLVVANKMAYSSCINAHGRSNNSIPKVDCLLP